jgi:hypothetical protein
MQLVNIAKKKADAGSLISLPVLVIQWLKGDGRGWLAALTF